MITNRINLMESCLHAVQTFKRAVYQDLWETVGAQSELRHLDSGNLVCPRPGERFTGELGDAAFEKSMHVSTSSPWDRCWAGLIGQRLLTTPTSVMAPAEALRILVSRK